MKKDKVCQISKLLGKHNSRVINKITLHQKINLYKITHQMDKRIIIRKILIVTLKIIMDKEIIHLMDTFIILAITKM